MKRLITIALLVALAGCGKVEEQTKPVRPGNCWPVTIIATVNEVTTFEYVADWGARARFNRTGSFGQPGDAFDYCE